MRITITASIRLLFVLTLVVISVVAQTGPISASAPSPTVAKTTRIPEIRSARNCIVSEESLRDAIATSRVACASRGSERHALNYGLLK